MASSAVKKSNKSVSAKTCELVFCEDPITGRMTIKPTKGTCPKGYVEKLRDRAMTEGVDFIIPKVSTRYVDENGNDTDQGEDEDAATE